MLWFGTLHIMQKNPILKVNFEQICFRLLDSEKSWLVHPESFVHFTLAFEINAQWCVCVKEGGGCTGRPMWRRGKGLDIKTPQSPMYTFLGIPWQYRINDWKPWRHHGIITIRLVQYFHAGMRRMCHEMYCTFGKIVTQVPSNMVHYIP